MAFKLTKAEHHERALIVEKLTEAKTEVEEAIAAFNAKMEEAWAEVSAKIETYNETVTAAAEFRDNIVEQRQGEWDDKSERWQEGDRGQSAQGWISEWEGASLEPLEVEQPEELEVPDMDHDETLGGLPDEVDG